MAVREQEGFPTYCRQLGDDRIERAIATSGASLTVCPVEPLNLPREVTRYLEVQFPPVELEPEGEVILSLTFPVEIGVFITGREDSSLIDVFTLREPKYSLYGPPDHGVVTRWHGSGRSHDPPCPDPLREGVLTLSVRNASRIWVEVGRVVLDAIGMAIFYSDSQVAMSATLTIFSGFVAETTVLGDPPGPGYTPSLPLYAARTIYTTKNVLVVEKKDVTSVRSVFFAEKKPFLMEFGVR